MLLDVRLSVLHGYGPLLVPPIRLRKYAAVHHREPIMAPEIDVDFGPVAIVLDLLRIEHERAIGAGAGDIGLQADFFDDRAVAIGKFFAELVYMSVIFARQHFTERRKARGHGNAVGVVGAAMKNFVIGDEAHHFLARAECAERETAADGFREADHVGLYAEEVAGAAPGEFRASLDFVKNQQRAVRVAEFAKSFEEARLRQAEAYVHQDRFAND